MGAATDLVRSKPELVAENALLRQQLIILTRSTKRPRLTRTDRALLVLLASRVRAWRQALLIVQPATLLRWHRAGFRLFWRWRSAPRPRQPRVAPETVALIQRMAREIVRSQVAKPGVCAGVGGRDDVADLDVAVGDHHAVDEQLDELAPLLEGGAVQPAPQPLAELGDGSGEGADLDQALALRRHLALAGE